MRWLLLLFLFLKAEAPQTALEIALNASVQIYTTDLHFVGSGTFVLLSDKPFLVTVQHLFDPGESYFACKVDEMQCREFTPVLPLRESDWVCIPLPPPQGVVATQVAKKKPLLNEELLVIASPSGRPWVSTAHVAWLYEDQPLAGKIGIDGFAYPGSSGGGLFDREGRLKGFITGILINYDSIALTPRLMEDQVVALPVPEEISSRL